MSYLSQGSSAQFVELKVQELVVSMNHAGAIEDPILTTSGSTATIDCGQNIDEVRCALFNDNSAGTIAPVVFANRVISGSTVTLTLSAAMAADDSITLYFVLQN